MCFGKARIFYENRELSDFDGIVAHVTFIQESVPVKAIRYLWKNGVQWVDDCLGLVRLLYIQPFVHLV